MSVADAVQENLPPDIWSGVGFHPTPLSLVRYFASMVADEVARTYPHGRVIQVLDACAGDGRLGHAVARRLRHRGFVPSITFVEASVDEGRFIRSASSYKCAVKRIDFFSAEFESKFDVVVSNPPYLTLSRTKAAELGISWKLVAKAGRNLYGLALMKCVEICKPGGFVGLLAPHGWLSNQRTAELRRDIAKSISHITIDAFSSRRLFPGVNQDVSVQVLRKHRASSDSVGSLLGFIGYDRAKRLPFSVSAGLSGGFDPAVKVGAFVWNRQKHLISKRSGFPIIYGGNIGQDGKIENGQARYAGRQFALRSKVPNSYVHKSPCIVIKRSMRGHPGKWMLDLAVCSRSGFEFVPENHVIVVRFCRNTKASDMHTAALRLKTFVESAHRHYGHPNVSVALIKRAMHEISKDVP